MSKKYVKFKEIVYSDGNVEHKVRNNKKQFLGDIAFERKKWRFYPDSPLHKTWFTSDCLHDIANYMEGLINA